MNRRNFIVNSILLLATTSIDAKTNQDKVFDMYIDESGSIGSGSFVIGALTIDSKYNHNILNQLRKKSKFNLRMSYKSSNKYKLDLVNPLLLEFFKSKDMKFSALIFPDNVNEKWPSEKKNRLLLYKYNYKNLLNLTVNKDIKLNIYLSTRLSMDEDNDLKIFLEQRFKNIKIKIHGSKNCNSNDNLTQFTDILTGSIYGDITGTEDKTKQKIIQSIKASLNVENLKENINFKKGKFILNTRNKI